MDSLRETLRSLADSRSRAALLARNKLAAVVYACGLAAVLFAYHFISDGDFSFLLTLGSLVRLLAFAFLAVRVASASDASPVSAKMLECYACVFFFRLCSLLYAQDYLPADPTGDWLYQAIEAVSLGVVVVLLSQSLVFFKSTYRAADDAFGKSDRLPLPHEYGALYLIVPTFIGAVLIHPTLNRSFIFDTSWTFAMYLETFAVLPQLYMFQKSSKNVDSATSHFVFALGLSRVFMLFFWMSSYHELATSKSFLGSFTGIFVFLCQVVHVVMMGDYMYYWVKSERDETPLSLPGLAV